MTFDNAVADRQAEPGSLPDRLGREEGVKQTRQVLGCDSWPVVGEVHPDHAVATIARR
jgi:hypothetical protein